jgi:uncharacterized membrane protein
MRLDAALVSFKSQHGAVSAFSAESTDAPWRHEVAFVEHLHNGRMVVKGTFAGHYVDVEESDHVSEPGALEGALTGTLVGAIFGLGFPGAAFGFVFGGTVGAVVGKPSETASEPKPLIDDLREAVPTGGSAVILFASPEHVDAMLGALAGAGGEPTRRSLSDEQTFALENLLSSTPHASLGPTEQGASRTS